MNIGYAAEIIFVLWNDQLLLPSLNSMTPAIRCAEKAGIEVGLHHYSHDPSNRHYGLEAAEALGVSPELVFKTLVLEILNSDKPLYALAVLPVAKTLNLKAIAAALGYKSAMMATPANAERVTGYIRGGISPLGTRSRLDTVLDASSSEFNCIYCSGGKRGLDISISSSDLVRLTNATIAPIAK
tara:strand:+ start:122 stop:673 length:552 start_codon:yes stop_codon:yes gene_type:complete